MKSCRYIILLLTIACSYGHAQWVRTNGPYGGWVRSFAVSGTTLYAGLGSIVGRAGVYRSTDGGDHWKEVLPGSAPPLQYQYPGFECWALLAEGSTVLAAPYTAGIYRSTDNGSTWSVANTGLSGLNVHALASFGGFYFAGTDSGLFRSSDEGLSWHPVVSGLGEGYVSDLVGFSTVVSSYLFASTASGVFRSTDFGASWQLANTGLPEYGVNSLAAGLNTIGGPYVFAGADRFIFRSTNYGTSWTQDTVSERGSFLALTSSGTSLFGGNWFNLYRSTDYGATWTKLDSLLPDPGVIALASMRDGQGRDVVLAGTTSGLFRSSDDGNSWTAANNGLIGFSVGNLGVIGDAWFAATERNGIFRSMDKGMSWIRVGEETVSWTDAFASCGGTLFAGSHAGGAYFSTDNGASWAKAEGLPIERIPAFALMGNEMFAGTYMSSSAYPGVYRSSDNGATWNPVTCTGLPYSCYVCTFANAGTDLFAGTNCGRVYRSTDRGENWMSADSGMTGASIYSLVAVPDGAGDTTLLAGAHPGGAFRSTDRGAYWSPANHGVPDSSAFILSASGTTAFAAVRSSFYVSTNAGLSWERADSGLDGNSIGSLFVCGSDVLVGTSTGVWSRPLAELVTGIGRHELDMPAEVALCQNYPNPFNPSTTIRYAIPQRSHVTLTVYNTLGQELKTLVAGEQEAGYHDVQFNASGLASGVYFYRLQAGNYTDTKKLCLVR